jgi:Holliday junction resolvasome RuvABC DNA-binding subunit
MKDVDLTDSGDGETKQLMDVLIDMGFDRREILSVIQRLDTNASIEQKIRTSLKLLGKKKIL